MRIDAYSQINQVYSTRQTTKSSTVKKTAEKDAFVISNSAKDYQIAKQAVLTAPDVREDKVNKIKEQMKSGTYSVSSESFAEKLIEKYQEQNNWN